MNETDPAPINLDELRMLPSWLREDAPAPKTNYPDRDTGPDQGRDRRGGPGGDRSSRFGDRNRDSRGDSRGPRPDRGGGDRGRSGPPPRGGGSGGGSRGGFREDRRSGPPTPPPAPVMPAPVRIEFIPDDRCMASIVKQIRTRHMAYPLFGLARMFLQEPARHALQISLLPDAQAAGAVLYQLGEDGPVSLDRQLLEKIGFDANKERYYVEETVQKDPPKGNYTSVARCRLSGVLLGPTNYHGYQLALRANYESRFSRRMSFEDYRRNIEVVNDPALVERWKEDIRTVVTISTREGEPPTVLNSPAEARAHFRQHYFEGLLRTGTSFRLPGAVARTLPDPSIMMSIRQAHEPELRYPAHFVQLLRQDLQEAGLHIFKHRKRFVYVSLARPTPFTGGGAVSENVAALLEIIGQNPLITRKNLAERILSGKPAETPSAPAASATSAPAEPAVQTPPPAAEQSDPTLPAVEELDTQLRSAGIEPTEPAEPVAASEASATEESPATPAAEAPAAAPVDDAQSRARAALAADLRFLVQAGHIIEFHNGTFDLPLPPKPKVENQPKKRRDLTTDTPVARSEAEMQPPVVESRLEPGKFIAVNPQSDEQPPIPEQPAPAALESDARSLDPEEAGPQEEEASGEAAVISEPYEPEAASVEAVTEPKAEESTESPAASDSPEQPEAERREESPGATDLH
jgi:hypothetical protein